MLRSPLSGVAIDNYLPGFYRTRFQVIARAPTYDAGQALINQALKTLKLPADSMIDTMTINFCRPVTLPVPFPLSSANLIEWSTNFEICFTDPGLAP
jgi:hypothetical protein